MTKYPKIEDLKKQIKQLNVLLEEIQMSNFSLRMNVVHEYGSDGATPILKVALTEAIYTERIDV